MLLEEWRRQNGLTYSKLGQIIGASTERARRVCLPQGARWRKEPTISELVKILDITGGAVQVQDFLVSNGGPSPPPGGASDARPAAPRRGSAGRPLSVTSAAGRKAAETRKRRKAASAEVGA